MMRFYFVILLFLSHVTHAQFFAPAYPNSITKNNLIVDYDFTNPISYSGTGTSVASATGTNLPATMYNTPIFYKDPGYLKFNAANGHYLLMGDFKNYYAPVTSATRSGVFTISLWFNPTATNGVVLADLNSTAIAANYHTTDIEMVGGYLKFSVWPKNSIITTASTVSLNTWHHVVLTYTGNSVVAYLDGALVGASSYVRDGPAMGSLTSSQYFAMGSYDSVTNMGSGAYGSFLLADVKYFATALSATEVSRLYVEEAPEYDLIYMLDASKNYLSYPGSGTTWNDISGAAKTATNAAGVSYSTSRNGMMYYNGTTSGYTDFNFNLGSATTLSIEMWVYPTTLTNSMFFGFNLYDVYANNGALGFNSSMGDNYGLTAAQVTNLGLLNNWNHYVFVMNSGNYLLNKIYINGVSQSLSQIQGSQNTSLVNFNGGVGRIASWIYSSSFMQNMYLSKFKIYRRELTQKEITNNYNNSILNIAADGLTPATASSSAYQIKQDYPSSTDGFYWIKNANINGGVPFKIYADMTTDGGGWTLIMKNSSYAGWTYANAIALNTTIPFSTNADITSTATPNYSIIGWADYIKKSSSGFQYMIDSYTRNSYGGIWTANAAYSFISTSNANTNITLNVNYGGWSYNTNNDGISQRMPWYGYVGSNTGFFSLSSGSGNWWGTLIANNSYYSPSPWIGNLGGNAANPGIIWYWVR